MLLQGLEHGRGLWVGHLMLGAQSSDAGDQPVQVAVVDTGEQMVLHLHVQAWHEGAWHGMSCHQHDKC